MAQSTAHTGGVKIWVNDDACAAGTPLLQRKNKELARQYDKARTVQEQSQHLDVFGSASCGVGRCKTRSTYHVCVYSTQPAFHCLPMRLSRRRRRARSAIAKRDFIRRSTYKHSPSPTVRCRRRRPTVTTSAVAWRSRRQAAERVTAMCSGRVMSKEVLLALKIDIVTFDVPTV